MNVSSCNMTWCKTATLIMAMMVPNHVNNSVMVQQYNDSKHIGLCTLENTGSTDNQVIKFLAFLSKHIANTSGFISSQIPPRQTMEITASNVSFHRLKRPQSAPLLKKLVAVFEG